MAGDPKVSNWKWVLIVRQNGAENTLVAASPHRRIAAARRRIPSA